MKTGLKIFLIVIAALLLTLATWTFIVDYKRSRLANSLSDYAKKKGIKNISADELQVQFNKLNNTEVNSLIKFFTLLDDGKKLQAVGMTTTVLPILTKIDLTALLT